MLQMAALPGHGPTNGPATDSRILPAQPRRRCLRFGDRTRVPGKRTGHHDLVAGSPPEQTPRALLETRTASQSAPWRFGRILSATCSFRACGTARYSVRPSQRRGHERIFSAPAYAVTNNVFEGFKFGDPIVHLDGTLLLIEPAAAKDYEAACKLAPKVPAPPGNTPSSAITPGVDEDPAVISPPVAGGGAVPSRKPKTFYGSAVVNAATAKMRLVQIAEEVISVLASDPNATVKVSVEISANYPSGASDQIKRAVTENTNSLGFKPHTLGSNHTWRGKWFFWRSGKMKRAVILCLTPLVATALYGMAQIGKNAWCNVMKARIKP